MRRLFDPLLADPVLWLDEDHSPGAPLLPIQGATGDWGAAAPDLDPGPDLLEPSPDLPEPSPDLPEPLPDLPEPSPEPTREPEPILASPPPRAARAAGDPASISYTRLLDERPDVLRSYYEAFHGPNNDPNSNAWMNRVGGDTPEAYAKYWYEHFGRWEGYAQGPRTAADTISPERILTDRPDVLRAFYEEYYGPGNDRHSDAWIKRVGGDTPEAYAKYWYEKFGKWEGYAQSDKAAAENIDVERLLLERQDVFRAYFTEYYGPNNDRNSSAWVERVGGDTVQDYAKYWYVTYGRAEGYNQRPPGAPDPDDLPTVDPPVHDPSVDPWNHQALFPDWRPPYEGWEPPPNIWHDLPSDPGLFG